MYTPSGRNSIRLNANAGDFLFPNPKKQHRWGQFDVIQTWIKGWHGMTKNGGTKAHVGRVPLLSKLRGLWREVVIVCSDWYNLLDTSFLGVSSSNLRYDQVLKLEKGTSHVAAGPHKSKGSRIRCSWCKIEVYRTINIQAARRCHWNGTLNEHFTHFYQWLGFSYPSPKQVS